MIEDDFGSWKDDLISDGIPLAKPVGNEVAIQKTLICQCYETIFASKRKKEEHRLKIQSIIREFVKDQYTSKQSLVWYRFEEIFHEKKYYMYLCLGIRQETSREKLEKACAAYFAKPYKIITQECSIFATVECKKCFADEYKLLCTYKKSDDGKDLDIHPSKIKDHMLSLLRANLDKEKHKNAVLTFSYNFDFIEREDNVYVYLALHLDVGNPLHMTFEKDVKVIYLSQKDIQQKFMDVFRNKLDSKVENLFSVECPSTDLTMGYNTEKLCVYNDDTCEDGLKKLEAKLKARFEFLRMRACWYDKIKCCVFFDVKESGQTTVYWSIMYLND